MLMEHGVIDQEGGLLPPILGSNLKIYLAKEDCLSYNVFDAEPLGVCSLYWI